ncbi:MAG: hypothetical protein QXT45_03130 [Candidatus Bilamarchaeaceae archaeon]
MRKLAILILFLTLIAHAENYVVVNSMDGRDVLSGIFYANVKGYPVKFMPYPEGSPDLLAAKVGGSHNILLIQSEAKPVSAFLRDALERRNNSVELYTSADAGNTNLDLAVRSGAKKFIIVDSAYADGALSVMSYAAMERAYVILSTKDNAKRIREIVKDADEITIYGYVDSEVKEQLADLNPRYIGKGEDRYADNVEISRMLMEKYNITMVVFTEGTFIEEGMVSSRVPFIFSGRVVPDVTYNFVKEQVREDRLKTAYLIGGTKIAPAIRAMRARIETELLNEGMNKTFGLWIRYGQAVPSAAGGVLGLDTFPLPAYIPRLNISEVVYNRASKSLMIRLDNLGDGPAYFITEIKIQVNGQDYRVLGENETKLIEYGDVAGLEYPLDLSEVEEGNVTAVVIVKYGSTKSVLEEYSYYSGPIAKIEYVDKSNVTAKSARYDGSRKIIQVTIRNNENKSVYVSSDVGLILDGELVRIRGPRNDALEPNMIAVQDFPVELSSEDLAANKNITVYLKYGGRPGFLSKESTTVLPLEYEEFPLWCIGGIVAIILVVILLVAYYYWKEKKKG